jgi:hypothetical protein
VAQPIIMNNPLAVTLNGIAPTLTGAGFVFKFAVEHPGVFHRNGDDVAILKELIHGTTIDNISLSTSNIEFSMSDIL